MSAPLPVTLSNSGAAALEIGSVTTSAEYLQSNDYTQAEIAFMLGFTDQSNFARAFKRWTGQTPSDYRKALLAPDH